MWWRWMFRGKVMNVVEKNKKTLEGQNYVRKAAPTTNYWFSFYSAKIKNLEQKFNGDFFLILYNEKNSDDDFYVIPYSVVEHVLVSKNETSVDAGAKDAKSRTARWSGNVKDHGLHVTNSGERIDVSRYFGYHSLLERAMTVANRDTHEGLLPLDANDSDPAPYDPKNITDGRRKITRSI